MSSTISIKSDLDDKKQSPPRSANVGRSASFNNSYEKQINITPIKTRRNLTVNFNSPNARYHLMAASALASKSSSVQRLTGTLENDNRCRLDELQRINTDLRVYNFIKIILINWIVFNLC